MWLPRSCSTSCLLDWLPATRMARSVDALQSRGQVHFLAFTLRVIGIDTGNQRQSESARDII